MGAGEAEGIGGGGGESVDEAWSCVWSMRVELAEGMMARGAAREETRGRVRKRVRDSDDIVVVVVCIVMLGVLSRKDSVCMYRGCRDKSCLRA